MIRQLIYCIIGGADQKGIYMCGINKFLPESKFQSSVLMNYLRYICCNTIIGDNNILSTVISYMYLLRIKCT